MNFYDLYSYENNEDLIMSICKHYDIQCPTVRFGLYGQLDVCFKINLNTYLVQVLDSSVVVKKESIRRLGQKHRKHYMSKIRYFSDGNIWWDLIKFIVEGSKI